MTRPQCRGRRFWSPASVVVASLPILALSCSGDNSSSPDDEMCFLQLGGRQPLQRFPDSTLTVTSPKHGEYRWDIVPWQFHNGSWPNLHAHTGNAQLADISSSTATTSRDKKVAWATVVGQSFATACAYVLGYTLARYRLDSTHENLAFVADDLPKEDKGALREWWDSVLEVPPLNLPAAFDSSNCRGSRPECLTWFMKIHVLKLVKYDYVVYLDADVVLHRPCADIGGYFSSKPDLNFMYQGSIHHADFRAMSNVMHWGAIDGGFMAFRVKDSPMTFEEAKHALENSTISDMVRWHIKSAQDQGFFLEEFARQPHNETRALDMNTDALFMSKRVYLYDETLFDRAPKVAHPASPPCGYHWMSGKPWDDVCKHDVTRFQRLATSWRQLFRSACEVAEYSPGCLHVYEMWIKPNVEKSKEFIATTPANCSLVSPDLLNFEQVETHLQRSKM
eukprot:CAMPEP_0206434936 /NCGR_PEP_ID=MMETSP0324_2-20121206/9512_1 /ASSEMBLY_ACC=CAM_ASM_000836 /TAXON_ID=2866 /ORGANISM="Crypthecodinium cohnii, Strain Seligo" /LENGTH=449 /DNA_ID=CAMNT_0053901661 /DNA_START=10 /DNA_END=1359 /DNA_ORIENTATION=+